MNDHTVVKFCFLTVHQDVNRQRVLMFQQRVHIPLPLIVSISISVGRGQGVVNVMGVCKMTTVESASIVGINQGLEERGKKRNVASRKNVSQFQTMYSNKSRRMLRIP